MIEIKCLYDNLVDPKSLKDHPKNRNKHGQDQIERLAKLYSYHGVRHPIIVSKLSGLIVAGHGRKLAGIRAGINKFPVVYQEFKDADAEYAFVQSDNAIALWADLDFSGINLDIENLGPDFDIDMLGIKGFVIEPADKYKDEEDSLPEVAESISKLGDIYQLGEHRLLCGDSTDKAMVERIMNGEKADMVFTDPPYGMGVVKADSNIGGNHLGKCVVYRPIIGDDKPYDPTHLMNMAELQIIFGANHFSDKLPCSPHWIVWHKEMPEGTDFSGAELAWTNIDKKAVKVFKFTWAGMTRQGDRKGELTKRVHPTQKPVGLFVDILNHYDPKSVIDVFGGSGSTLIACEKTNRKCFMMELDPHYIDVIVTRWCKYTGKTDIKRNGETMSWTINT